MKKPRKSKKAEPSFSIIVGKENRIVSHSLTERRLRKWLKPTAERPVRDQ